MPDIIYSIEYEQLKGQPMFYFNDYYIEYNVLSLVRETQNIKFTLDIYDVKDVNQDFLSFEQYLELQEITEGDEHNGYDIYHRVYGKNRLNKYIEDIEDTIDYHDYLETIVYDYIVRNEHSLDNLNEYQVIIETKLI